MPYLIDGNNLCGAARDARLGLPRTEEGLIRTLARFRQRRTAPLTVVFDGPKSERRGMGRAGMVGGLTVHYSGAGRTADELILEIVGRSRNPRDIVLVTSDRSLRTQARALGCRVMGCSEFAHRLADAGGSGSPETEEKPLPGDVEEWERYFTSRGRRGPFS